MTKKSSPVFSGSSKSRRRRGRQNAPRNPARSDVYEYQSQKVRRANIPLSLDKEEENEHGFDSDGDLVANARKPRLIGEDVEDEKVPSEDDEELDSDAAFEESDEERFAGFSFPKVRHVLILRFNALSACVISLVVKYHIKGLRGTMLLAP
jgi:U3 small nucleolar RNA-associated protein 14